MGVMAQMSDICRQDSIVPSPITINPPMFAVNIPKAIKMPRYFISLKSKLKQISFEFMDFLHFEWELTLFRIHK